MNLTRKRRFQASFVLSIDIGTTYSAVAYSIVPINEKAPFFEQCRVFQEVNRWPKQIPAGPKIPSVVYYDSEGKPRLHGAETEDEGSLFDAEQADWKKAEWWKLLLRPEYLPMPDGFQPAFLPDGITVDDVFRDHMTYLRDKSRDFFVKSHVQGAVHWEELSKSMEIVLTAPNGWEGRHQNRMRQAAISAGLVGPNEGARIRFVSEGEAAIHFCLECANIRNRAQIGNTVIICDAGGGTIDIGVYRINNISPTSLEEICSPRCLIAGGAFVTATAGRFIEDRLRGSAWDNPECLSSAINLFEKQVKRRFNGTEQTVHLALDGSKISDELRGISRGRLIISRANMISFFEPSLRVVRQGLESAALSLAQIPDQIFVVGGFAESDYVFSELQEWAKVNNLEIAKPDDSLSKAVTYGALTWYDQSAVQFRIARMHYGVEIEVPYSSENTDMTGRVKFQNILGEWRVRNAWHPIVRMNARIRNGEQHCASFHRAIGEDEDLIVELELYAYHWSDPPTFLTHKGMSILSSNESIGLSEGRLAEGFLSLGTVQGDLTDCFNAGTWKTATTGKKYKYLNYDVCLCFGDIEMSACLRWRGEDGKVKRGNATIVYV